MRNTVSRNSKKPGVRKQRAEDSFAVVARALECDESEETFDKALKKIGGRQTAPLPKKRKRSA